jgi:cardiolipin synthase
MRCKLIVSCALGLIILILGMWWLYHIRAPPSFDPPPLNPSLSLIVEPADGIEPVLSRIEDATHAIDLAMYDLEDTTVETELVAAKERGVAVRVLLNKGYYGAQSPANEKAYIYLQSHGVLVRWTSAQFSLTHEKLLIADDDALIMGFNLTPKYYSTSRDFAIEDSDKYDVSSLEEVFDADWQGSTPPPSSSDSDIVWSPRSESELISLITYAKHSILIYNEEMSDEGVIKALQDAASRGVSVNVIMTYQSTWRSAFLKLIASGVHIRAYPESAPVYIHAKMVLVDNKIAFIGSQNFSSASLTTNRELGILVTNPKIISTLLTTFAADWNNMQ